MVDGVKFAISNLKLGKSAGPDHMYTVVKHLVIYITTLFNIIFSAGNFPKIWRKALIIPIHKKNDVNDGNSYRGVTLLGL